MVKIDWQNVKNIHFIGIGGVSMSSLAQLMVVLGKTVSGSDRENGVFVKKLKRKNFDIKIGSPLAKDGVDLVVFTDAINADNLELIGYIQKGVQTISRGEFLQEVGVFFDKVLAVSGSHGKTTTTAMLGHVFLRKKNATLHLGGEDVKYGNFVNMGNEIFITEACEYKRNIEKIYSHTCVVTNLDFDHVDCYENMSELKKSFSKFMAQSSHNIILFEDVEIGVVSTKANIIKVGFSSDNDVECFRWKETEKGYVFHIKNYGQYVGRFILNIYGKHNLKNALCVVAACLALDVSYLDIYEGLKDFKGVKRRQEFLGKVKGLPFFADYSHHPTEIKSSIQSFRQKYKNLLVIFQPHTYSRTRGLMNEFSTSFIGAKKLVMYKTYSAREQEDKEGNETILFKKIKRPKKKFLSLNVESLKNILQEQRNNIDAVVILGAGNIYEIMKKYCKSKKNLD